MSILSKSYTVSNGNVIIHFKFSEGLYCDGTVGKRIQFLDSFIPVDGIKIDDLQDIAKCFEEIQVFARKGK